MDNLKEIAGRFALKGELLSVDRLGDGLINDTFVVRTAPAEAPDYVLQRVNNAIFRDVDLLQDNLLKITTHIRRRLEAAGASDIDRRTLTVVPATDGKLYYFDGTDYWRMTVLIPGSKSHNQATPEMAYRTGLAFGEFHGYFSGDDVPELRESIPDFHNIPFRIAQLREAAAADPVGRLAKVKPIVDELLARADEMSAAETLNKAGLLPKRISHCDTKVNNILFDENDNLLCVIDLDTTMPGYVLSDFGDFIRTAGNTGAEDDTDLSRVGVNMDVFRAFAKGYIESAKFLTPKERELLPFGAAMLTYMQTVRFLTDYINGDTYYKITHPEHNYERTLAQRKLLQSIDEHMDEMNAYIASL